MMNKIDDGGPAFPTDTYRDSDYNQHTAQRAGMTLRDWFAGMALQAVPHIGCGADLDTNEIALAAFQLADAMLEARKEGGAK